jgi:hypothetical protein
VSLSALFANSDTVKLLVRKGKSYELAIDDKTGMVDVIGCKR